MSLRLRLTLWYAALLAVSLLAFGSLLYIVLQASLEHQLDEALLLRATQITRNLSPGADGRLDPSDLTSSLLAPRPLETPAARELYVQLLDQRGEVVGQSGSSLPIDPETILRALGRDEVLQTLPLTAGRSVRLLSRPIEADGAVVGVIQVGETLDGVEATLRQVRDILALGAIVVLGLAVSGGLLLAGRALAPVRGVSATARRITVTADFGQRLPSQRRRDEVGELVETFNALIARVEATLAEQQRFLADTSHELRSPLTVIRANLGFLRRELDSDTRAECVREAEDEAQRMGRLIGDLLLLGQAESSELLRRAPLAIADLIVEVAEQARVQASDRTIEVAPLQPITLNADRDRLKQVIWNLVENALRYSPSGGAIRLSAVQEADQAVIAVSDEGPGIDPEHLPHLFERFYRVDRARSRATGGAGLGLAIVQHLVKAHGGSVAVQSQPGQGTTFTLRLPGIIDSSPVAERLDQSDRSRGRPALTGASR
jgi:two-component system, OmpR family, sensor kinase